MMSFEPASSIDTAERTKPKRIPVPKPGADFNPVEEVIYRRRSVRLYLRRPVPEYLVRRVLEAGRFAPSAGNAQPWKFIVVQDPTLINEMTHDIVAVCRKVKRFADYTAPGMERKEWRAKLLQRLMPSMFHPIPFSAMGLIAEGRFGVWHGATTVILLLADMRAPGKPALDIGIAGQNIVLAAHSMGLGTCWVSFVTALEPFRKWKKRFDIRYPYKLLTSIGVGFPKGVPDGPVPRETQAIDWYTADGEFKVVF
jgi:nitroreductase